MTLHLYTNCDYIHHKTIKSKTGDRMAAMTKEVAMGDRAGAPGAKTSSYQHVNAIMKISFKLVNAVLMLIIIYIGVGVFLYGLYVFGFSIPVLDAFFSPAYELYKIPLRRIISSIAEFDDELLLLAFFFIWMASLMLIMFIVSKVTPVTSKVFSGTTTAMMPASWHFENGESLMRQGNYSAAIAEFNAALKKSPGYPGAYFNLGYMDMKTSQYNNAAGFFQEELRSNPAHFDSRLYAGYCYLRLGRANDAIRELLDATMARPENGFAHGWLGNAYHLAGKHNEALQAFQKVKSIAPDHENLDLNIGEVHYDMGSYDDAIAALKLATNKAPGNDLAHYKLGLAYGKKGRHEDAIAEYNAAIRINPQNAEYRDMLELTKSSQKSAAASVPQKEILKEKEIIKEIVKVPCEYCQTLVDITQAKCPICGAPLRGK